MKLTIEKRPMKIIVCYLEYHGSMCVVFPNLVLVASSSMSFFSDLRLDDLSARLGHDALKSLVAQISGMVKSRVEVLHRNLGPSSIWNQSGDVPRLSPQRARHLINSMPIPIKKSRPVLT
jgi:hypothetical protein